MNAPASPVVFDAFAPEHRADPYSRYALVREAVPFLDSGMGVEFVTRHAECSAVLSETAWSHRDEAEIFHPDAERVDLPTSFLWMDPPDHTRLRSLVSKAFTPKVVVDLTPRITELVTGMLDSALAAGTVEAIEAIAYPLPLIVICELMGVPEPDQAMVHRLGPALARGFDPDPVLSPQERRARDEASRELLDYFRTLIARRREHPRDDLVSALGAVHDRGDTLTEHEMLATCITLLIAGHETTVNMVGNGLLALQRNPAQLDLLRRHPEFARSAADEILRYDSPVHMTTRTARRELVVGDRTFAAGEHVCVLVGSANRDPRVFDRPDEFDVTRYAPGTSTPRHLGFALGIHYCMGAALARLEGEILLTELARRVRVLEPAGEPVYRPNLLIRGLRELPLTFR
ncbi:cytochrome P450 [Pseudonocardia abyssalis]|uniref:Cytochrome P450 n=1 Tax=Pseudonocardia abyssalis TaxID=2792008 RepID=A0ABS6UNL9_9PSEU|nr:cytochrome P450 [Pseudonocardia abyssalis]MBW0118073.1 cytochrome P450 [Pseudonocardia abyssalis]MBW0133852.1 cytochrome P450 [Pseudonocardia abyssalis]